MKKSKLKCIFSLFLFIILLHSYAYTLEKSNIELNEVSKNGEILKEDFRVKATTKRYGHLLATNMEDMNSLYISVNDGVSFFKISEFNSKIQSIHVSDTGKVFISTTSNRWDNTEDSALYRSGANITEYKKALKIKSGAVDRWNFDSLKNTIYISEYGFKSLKNNTTTKNKNARRIYKSIDDGLSWKIIYEPEPENDFHLHKTLIDSANGDIYQVYGDTKKGILKSEDQGNSWETIVEGIHPTSAIDIGDDILFGLDNSPFSGVVKMNKETYEVSTVLKAREDLGGSVYSMEKYGDIVLAFFSSYDFQDWNGSVAISFDKGNTWGILEEIQSKKDIGVGLFTSTQNEDYIFISGSFPKLDSEGNYRKFSGTIKYDKNKLQKERLGAKIEK